MASSAKSKVTGMGRRGTVDDPSRRRPSQEPQAQRGMARGPKDPSQGEDRHGLVSAVAEAIEQLRTSNTSAETKERLVSELCQLAQASSEARSAVGHHAQAIPLLVGMLRSGTLRSRTVAAGTLGALCCEEELRVKVLLGGCIPPLLALLKQNDTGAQTTAAQVLHAVSRPGPASSRDTVGTRIFASESVVPALMGMLRPAEGVAEEVKDLLTATLRNLSGSLPGFWVSVEMEGGLEMFSSMVSSDRPRIQENAAALLASYLTAPVLAEAGKGKGVGQLVKYGQQAGSEETAMSTVEIMAERAGQLLDAGTVPVLLTLVEFGKEVPVRAEVAGVLRAATSASAAAREAVAGEKGVGVLIRAIVAPAAEMMTSPLAQKLQENALGALANVAGGSRSVVGFLAAGMEACSSDDELADTMGALGYAMLHLKEQGEKGTAESGREGSFEEDGAFVEGQGQEIEQRLVARLTPEAAPIVQERAMECLQSLYSCPPLAQGLASPEAKRILIELIALSPPEEQADLVEALLCVCSGEQDLWGALQGRDGVLHLVGLLGLSTTQEQQECACALLRCLTEEVEESKWAITAAGGIPTLVSLLSTGTASAKEDAALLLGNLCECNEDIRACVETADAGPALMHLLTMGSPQGQEVAASTLMKLMAGVGPSPGILGHLGELLLGEVPESKGQVLRVLGHILGEEPELMEEGSGAHEALQTLLGMLEAEAGESKREAAAVLADLLTLRTDFRQSGMAEDTVPVLLKMVQFGGELVAVEAARALSVIFSTVGASIDAGQAGRESILPLLELAKSRSMAVAEVAAGALSQLLGSNDVAGCIPVDEMVGAMTRLLREGKLQGKANAAVALGRMMKAQSVAEEVAESMVQHSTVLALVALLPQAVEECPEAAADALDALSVLAKSKGTASFSTSPLQVLAESPYSMSPLVAVVARPGVTPSAQEKAIEVLSRLCKDQPVVLGDLIAGTAGCTAALAERVTHMEASLELKVGGTALLICAAKEHRQASMEALSAAGHFHSLVSRLVEMLSSKEEPGGAPGGEEGDEPSAAVLVKSVALWLLALMASQSDETRSAVAGAGAVGLLVDRLAAVTAQGEAGLVREELDGEEGGGSSWVSSLLLAILFGNRDVVRDSGSLQPVGPLVQLIGTAESSGRYFAVQALASLVTNGSRGTLLNVVNSGGLPVLLSSLARMEEEDLGHLHALAEDFGLPKLPEQAALEKLFRCDDARIGPKATAAIPELVRILRVQIEEQQLQLQLQQQLQGGGQVMLPGAQGGQTAGVVLGLLRQLAGVGRENRMVMAAAGVMDAASKYLSQGAEEGGQDAAVELLRLLMTAEEEVRVHASEAIHGVVERLALVLQTGTRAARLKAAGALEGLFSVDVLKQTEVALSAVGPLLEMLSSASVNSTDPAKTQEATVAAGTLAKLAQRNTPRFMAVAQGEKDILGLLLRLVSDERASDDARESVGLLLQAVFSFPAARNNASPSSAAFIPPLVSLLSCGRPGLQLRAVGALDMLMEDDRQADNVAAAGPIPALIALLVPETAPAAAPTAHALVVSCLFKLAKDRRSCKIDMVDGGVLERITELLPSAQAPLVAVSVELFRVLTNNTTIARGPAAAGLAGPIFQLLQQQGQQGQEGGSTLVHTSALQTLVNIVDQPGKLELAGMRAADCVSPLVQLLTSPSLIVQQLSVGLIAHLLTSDHFGADPVVVAAARPLLGMLHHEAESFRLESLKALDAMSLHWPTAITDTPGGVEELSRLIMTTQPPVGLLAASVLANLIRNVDYRVIVRVHVPVYIRLLRSGVEAIQVAAVAAISVLEREDSARAEAMVKQGLVEALLDMLRAHQSEEMVARLLEGIFNNQKLRESPQVLRSIGPIASYLLDPNTTDPSAKLLAALALGDLFQESSQVMIKSQQQDLTAVCQALLSLLHEGEGTGDLHMVALCGLQNLVANSRTNKRAVAEAGGINMLIEMLPIASPEVTSQVANLLRLLLNNHTIQEYATPELLSSLVAVVERDLWKLAVANEEVLQAIEGLLHTFAKLRVLESATAAVPVLIGSMKVGSEAAQELVLNVLWMLRQGWAQNKEAARLQMTAMGEAVPVLQLMLRSGPINLYEKAEALLCALPGSLTVCLRRGANLKMNAGSTNAYCKVQLGDTAPQLTKVIQNCMDPQWKHYFIWPLDGPPRGLNLHISCKNKGSLGTSSLGKVSIPIDRVVALGTVSGTYLLQPDTNRDGSQRSLDVEFTWSNRESALPAGGGSP